MNNKRIISILAILAIAPAPSYASLLHHAAPGKPSMMQRMKMHMPMMGHGMPMASKGKPAAASMAKGEIIGNKKTHVYHLPGTANLPAPANRVYFTSVQQAVAEGYHGVGSSAKKTYTVKKRAVTKMHTAAKKK